MRTTTILGAATLAVVASVPLAPGALAAAEPDRPAAIAFASDRDGDNEIYLRAADGTVTQLTKNRHDDHDPVWSPNGGDRQRLVASTADDSSPDPRR